jgi:hypothetical protein
MVDNDMSLTLWCPFSCYTRPKQRDRWHIQTKRKVQDTRITADEQI